MDRSQVRWIWISIAFSALVLIGVLITTFDERTIGYILRLNLGILLAGFALRILSLVFWAARIQSMSRALGYRVKYLHCLNL
ncbi:MAG: lysylphosphatidylglycerol synthetase, partial [Methanoregulaceae archaeon]|nr:lysylphosphatidylglycerol synthetase [Methanoregulaceae archaeon]